MGANICIYFVFFSLYINRGVKNYRGTKTEKLRNRETREPVSVPVAKNKKPETPVSGVYIYIIIYFNIFCYQFNIYIKLVKK
jgi:hypothetical protein